MIGVSQYTHRVARPRFREGGAYVEDGEPREALVPETRILPVRPGVVRVMARRSVWAAWTLRGVLC